MRIESRQVYGNSAAGDTCHYLTSHSAGQGPFGEGRGHASFPPCLPGRRGPLRGTALRRAAFPNGANRHPGGWFTRRGWGAAATGLLK